MLQQISQRIATAEASLKRQARRQGMAPQSTLRFYTLKLNVPEKSDVPGEHGRGGWTVAWHRVRGHLRHLKSGRVVRVRAHTKGDPRKGIVMKDYELTVK